MTTTTATQTTARCARCGRALTSARALRTGYGPTCYTKVRTAAREAATRHKPHQTAKAIELIEDGGVVPTTRAGVYHTVGTNGEIYKTARTGCTCPAGLTARHPPPLLARPPAPRAPPPPHPPPARPGHRAHRGRPRPPPLPRRRLPPRRHQRRDLHDRPHRLHLPRRPARPPHLLPPHRRRD